MAYIEIFDSFKKFVRALRLPFISASILPFVFGSLIAKGHFHTFNFILGMICVTSTHLSGNLINDYADSVSGADWQDKHFYNFFGGSKLIQENALTENFYLKAAKIFSYMGVLSVIALALVLKSAVIILLYLIILILALTYSKSPFRFSYNRFGEVIIFLLFGPAVVMGGYFIQTKVFPSAESFVLSLPFGFLTTAILFANEIPDCSEDLKVGKHTLVSLAGPERSYIIYYILIFLAFFSISLDVIFGYLTPMAFFSFAFIVLALKSTYILKRHPRDKAKLVESSKLTIMLHGLVSVSLILTEVIWPVL